MKTLALTAFAALALAAPANAANAPESLAPSTHTAIRTSAAAGAHAIGRTAAASAGHTHHSYALYYRTGPNDAWRLYSTFGCKNEAIYYSRHLAARGMDTYWRGH